MIITTKKSRFVPKHTRGVSWLTFLPIFLLSSYVYSNDSVIVAPDVNIFESPDQVFELPGSGDYIPVEEIRKFAPRLIPFPR